MVWAHGPFKDNKDPFPPPGKDDIGRVRRSLYRDY